MTTEDLLNYFYRTDTIVLDGRKAAKLLPARPPGRRQGHARRAPSRHERAHREEGPQVHQGWRSASWSRPGIEQLPIALEEVVGRVSAHDVIDPKTRRGPPRAATRRSPRRSSSSCAQRGIDALRGALPRRPHIGPSLRNTLLQDKIAEPARRRSSRSTAASARAIRPRPRPRRPSSTTSSSTPSATTSRASAGSS